MATRMEILISARDQATKALRGIKKGLKKLGKTAKKVTKGIGSAFKAVMKVLPGFKTALAGVAGAVGMGMLVKSSMNVIDKLGKVSSKLGVTSSELQKFRYAAQLAGIEETALDMGLQRFIRRVGEAAKGTGEAKDALAQMGIKLTNSNGKIRSATNLLGQVANALKDTKDPAERLRLAFKLFDSEGVAMVNMLKNGKGALTATMMEADKLGFVLSENTVKGVEKANDAFYKMGTAITGVWQKMVGSLSPSLEKFATWWTTFAGSFSNSIQPLFAWLESALGTIAVNFGTAEEAGKKWGQIVGYHVVEITKKIIEFFTKVKDGKTQWQSFRESAVRAFQDAKRMARDFYTAILAIGNAIKRVASAFRKFQSMREKGKGVAYSIGAGFGELTTAPSATRATGGGVRANRPYLVGERGAEVFTPTTSGKISADTGGTSTVTNIYTSASAHGINNALGARGDNINRGARVGMNVARGRNAGGFGNLSMARAR